MRINWMMHTWVVRCVGDAIDCPYNDASPSKTARPQVQELEQSNYLVYVIYLSMEWRMHVICTPGVKSQKQDNSIPVKILPLPRQRKSILE
jgi:hypothetical protein